MKKPLIVEFIGAPEAGKTSTINALINLLKAENLKVAIVEEAASKIYDYLPKDTNNYGIWVIVATTKELIENLNQPYDIILVDRGLLDRLFWNIYSY